MQNLGTHGLDNEYYNYKSEPTPQRTQNLQKNDFKMDINDRLSMINDIVYKIGGDYHLIII